MDWYNEKDISSDLSRSEILKIMGFDPNYRYVVKLTDSFSDIRFDYEKNVIELTELGQTSPNVFVTPTDLDVKNDFRIFSSVFSGIISQYRSLANAYMIASRVAHNNGYYLSLKDFLAVVNALAKPVQLKTTAINIESVGKITQKERQELFEQLKRLRIELLEKLYALQTAREAFDESFEKMKDGDMHFTAEMQKTSVLSLEVAEKDLERVLKQYLSLEEKLLGKEGLIVYDNYEKAPVVTVFKIEEDKKELTETKTEEKATIPEYSADDLRITLPEPSLTAEFK